MKALRSSETSSHLLVMVEIGYETQIIGEPRHIPSVLIKKTSLLLKIKPRRIQYLLIKVYCYARFGKIMPFQAEINVF